MQTQTNSIPSTSTYYNQYRKETDLLKYGEGKEQREDNL